MAASTASGNGNCLYLIDAMALAYRAHYIFISRPLMNSKGQNTSASYGFTNALLKLIEQHDMKHIAVVFDKMDGEGTFRDELYEEYKANREPPPEDLLANLPIIKDIVRALDIPVIERAGVEADDVIGTLARRAAEEEADVVIVSPDKDFQQLLSPRISIFKPARQGEEFDPITAESFREEHGLEPEQFIDMLALMGDSSDNVPGVYGIGPKTAVKLMRKYDSVENLLAHRDEVSGKRASEGLAKHADEALLSKKLVTIKTDLDLKIDWENLQRHETDAEALIALFEELEFTSLLRKLRTNGDVVGIESSSASSGDGASNDDTPAEGTELSFDFGPYEEVQSYDAEAVDYATVETKAQLEALFEALALQETFAFDTETTSLNTREAELVGVAFSWAPQQGRYVPTPLPDGTPTAEVLDQLRPHLTGDRLKVGQNLKYDLLVLAQHGVAVDGPLFDTMVAHYLVTPEDDHDLGSIARAHLNYRMQPIEELIGEGKNQRSMREVPIAEVGPYACEDADIALRLAAALREALEEHELLEIAEDMEFPLIHVLVAMEREGIRVDPEILADIDAKLTEQLQTLERQIYKHADEEFNINSTQQLGTILFEKLELRVVSKTSTGRPSTKESVLEELSTEHELPGLILDWRKLAKLKSTYVDSLGDLIDEETGRIHTTFNQTITATGRLSSSSPNLQNIPVRTAQGREIRRAFVPRAGWTLMAADYVQIELRILASMSGDEALTQDFIEGKDIHTATAARVFKKDPEDIVPDERRKAKEVNYGIPYGVSAWGLAQRLRSTPSEAQDLIDEYQKTYPRVSRWLNEQVERAREQGYVETLLGRRRFVPGINARNSRQRSFYERVAVNMPIQGTQADMIKIAMVRLHRRMQAEEVASTLLLQVHDELVLDVAPNEQDLMRAMVEEEMVAALPLEVPVTVEIDTGPTWLDAH